MCDGKVGIVDSVQQTVPKPNNVDADLRPPTKMNAAINPKYSFVETFDRIPFTGTTEKMRYCQPDSQSVNPMK
jgi:hypothetical protein